MEQENSQPDHVAVPTGTAESLSTKSVASLARDACAMPWEDRAPFSVRYEFTQAVTPELFVEVLDALQLALPRLAHKAACHSARRTSEWAAHGSASFDNCDCEIKAVRAAIAKATAA